MARQLGDGTFVLEQNLNTITPEAGIKEVPYGYENFVCYPNRGAELAENFLTRWNQIISQVAQAGFSHSRFDWGYQKHFKPVLMEHNTINSPYYLIYTEDEINIWTFTPISRLGIYQWFDLNGNPVTSSVGRNEVEKFNEQFKAVNRPGLETLMYSRQITLNGYNTPLIVGETRLARVANLTVMQHRQGIATPSCIIYKPSTTAEEKPEFVELGFASQIINFNYSPINYSKAALESTDVLQTEVAKKLQQLFLDTGIKSK